MNSKLLSVWDKVSKFAVVVLLTLVVGAHWFLLQSIAWVGMFADNAQSGSVTQALTKTFNGENPCWLCLAVQQGQQAEKKAETIKVETRIDLFFHDGTAVCLCPELRDREPSPPFSAMALARFEQPPAPPPRSA